MSSLKSTLVGLLVVVLFLAGAYVAFNRTNGFKNISTQLSSLPAVGSWFSSVFSESDAPAKLQPLMTSASEQTAILADRLGTSQKVLGNFIEVNEADEDKPLSEQVLTKAQYMYCKAVVDEWEKENTAQQEN